MSKMDEFFHLEMFFMNENRKYENNTEVKKILRLIAELQAFLFFAGYKKWGSDPQKWPAETAQRFNQMYDKLKQLTDNYSEGMQ